MKRIGHIIISTVLIAALPTISCAGIGDIDNREYADWSSAPYNRIVYFYPQPFYTCTAQYVAPDIILTARHCITENRKYDKNRELGKTFQIWTHDNRRTSVVLEKYGKDFQTGDWALLRVTDPQFHRTDFFDVTQKTITTQIDTAGFAGMRILNNDEIRQIKSIFSETIGEYGFDPRDYNSILEKSWAKMDKMGIRDLYDNRVPNSTTPGEWEFKLKTTRGCKISDTMNRGRFTSSCDTDHGDSGGAYFKNGTLYGIVSGGLSGFDDNYNLNFGVRPESFAKELQKMKQSSPTVADLRAAAVDESGDDTDDIDDAQINDIQQTLDETDAQLVKRAKNIRNMTDAEFLKFLSQSTDYQILQDKLTRAKERENSRANRILGAVTMAATGFGGKMLASGIAAQNADADAMADMTAYIATFACGYGAGRDVHGGQTDVFLPTDETLNQLRQQYKKIAAQLKQTKAQLGIAPGIESDEIIDIADGGLYDNESNARTDGALTSVYRAITNPGGADAEKWAAQQSSAKKQVTTGAIVGGVGAVGAMVGNLIINRDKDDENDTVK